MLSTNVFTPRQMKMSLNPSGKRLLFIFIMMLSACQSTPPVAPETTLEAIESQPCQSIDDCVNRLSQVIIQNWHIEKLYDPKLMTKIQLRFFTDGQLKDVMLIESSGDQSLDRSVLEATNQSSPFLFIEESSESIRKGLFKVNMTFSVIEANVKSARSSE